MSYRKRRNKNKKQLRVVILSTAFILLFITTGYAAISTNITLNAKGNIVQLPKELSEITKDVVTTGDGLYQDTVETDRYIYKGTNPNNYIKFNGDELWRIYSIESDGSIKIVKDEKISDVPFDPDYEYALDGVSETNSVIGTRYSNTLDDYCYYNSGNESSYYGCNPWGSKYTTLDSSGSNITSMSATAGSTSTTYTLPESEAYLNVYLNHQFNNAIYKGLNSTKDDYEEINLLSYYSLNSSETDLVQTRLWNIGSSGYSHWNYASPYGSTTAMTNLVSYEKYYKWSGKVGLLTTSEFLRANTDISNCYTLNDADTNYLSCKTTNYLYKSSYSYWFLSPTSDYRSTVLYSHFVGVVSRDFSRFSLGVRPSVYLCSGITLKGEGTSEKPYTIQGNCKE